MNRLRCWICLGSGYIRTAHYGDGGVIPAMPCTNPHCPAGVEARAKRVRVVAADGAPPEETGDGE